MGVALAKIGVVFEKTHDGEFVDDVVFFAFVVGDAVDVTSEMDERVNFGHRFPSLLVRCRVLLGQRDSFIIA